MTYCPKCGERLKDGDAFCRYCGAPIARESEAPEKAAVEAQEEKGSATPAEPAPILQAKESSEQTQAQPKTGVRGGFCRNCGKELIGTPEICMNCGAKPSAGNSFCQACGAETNPLAEICIKCGVRLAKAGVAAGDVSPKSRLAATLLAWFLGGFGAHRFYLGKTATAIGMLALTILGWITIWIWGLGFLFLVAVGIWAFVDFLIAVTGNMKDLEGKFIKNW